MRPGRHRRPAPALLPWGFVLFIQPRPRILSTPPSVCLQKRQTPKTPVLHISTPGLGRACPPWHPSSALLPPFAIYNSMRKPASSASPISFFKQRGQKLEFFCLFCITLISFPLSPACLLFALATILSHFLPFAGIAFSTLLLFPFSAHFTVAPASCWSLPRLLGTFSDL